MDAEWWQPWPSAYLCPSAEGEADRRAENSESLTCLQLTEHLSSVTVTSYHVTLYLPLTFPIEN